jgi:hypothetical protein
MRQPGRRCATSLNAWWRGAAATDTGLMGHVESSVMPRTQLPHDFNEHFSAIVHTTTAVAVDAACMNPATSRILFTTEYAPIFTCFSQTANKNFTADT